MADLYLHQLADASPLTGDEYILVDQDGDSLKTTAQAVANLAVIVPGPAGPAGPAGPPGPNTITNTGTTIIGGTDGRLGYQAGGKFAELAGAADGDVPIWIASLPGFTATALQAVFVTYGPAAPANWNGPAPVQVGDALDRIAAWIAANFPLLPPP